jgi:hypothetical protein
MIERTYALCFSLCALANWRVAYLLARENGPLHLIARPLERGTQRPQIRLCASPVSKDYLDRVIRGV